MNTKRIPLVIGLALTLAAPAVFAGSPTRSEDKPRHKQQWKAQMLQKYDTNGDGVLDAQERAAMRADRQARRAERRAAMLARFDANGDGVLDEQERAVMRQAHADVRFDRLLARFDANGDGAVQITELAVGDGERAARMQQRLARLDANGDGVITRAEYRAGAAKMHGKRGKRMHGKDGKRHRRGQRGQ